ncbi:hypothetical protein QFC19_003402 [Naganishia cerealis]|uniref:Uncharacterized protein n=1 Tax=Naganishia cerealis TaxID=610337 RepID=A0ACC2W2K3_9TREE|nr:hypothetical protein QFC19_003402 [Naganishia cerealis]
MTRTTGLKRAPYALVSAGADPPPAPRQRSHAPVTGRKGPPACYIPDVMVVDVDELGEADDVDREDDDEEDDDDEDSDRPVVDEDSSDEEGFVNIVTSHSEEFSKRQLELIQLASDLSANDDLLSCIFVDTFGSMAAKDDLGVYYHQGDFIKPYFNRAELVKMAQETIVQGNVQTALDRSLRLVVFRNRIAGLRSTTQIKKFVAHLKRYLMLYHPSSRVEIRTTDRYRFATQKSELAVHATVDLDPGLTEYVLMDLRDVAGGSPTAANNNTFLNGIPNRVNGQKMAAELAQAGIDWTQEPRPQMLVLDEITGAMEVMPKTWEQRLSGNNIEDDPSTAKNAITAAQSRQKPRNVPYGDMGLDDTGNAFADPSSAQQTDVRQKMAEIRDFSVVNSGRQGLMLFLGPGRFINHDCSPNVELITTKRNVITFRVLRRIRVGEELTTWYHRGGFTRVPDENESVDGVDREGEPETSKRTSAEARRSAGRASTYISDEVQFESGMGITITAEGMEIGDGFTENGDDDVDSCDKGMDVEATKMDGLVQDVATRRRSMRTLNSASSLPARMAESMSVSMSARASPESSATGSSPSRESARNKRRAAARGRERTSHMLHNPFGYSKVSKPSGPSTVISNGLEHKVETADSHVERDEPGTLRCTVCLQIMEPVWVSNRYVEQCKRCIRHKAIYGFKWPARAKHEEQPYPPVNMRPSWWVPPKISRHRFRSATPPAIQPNNDDDGVQMSDGEREATALEEQARREAKRTYRWQVLQAEAAAKFRKDLEAAQEEMKRIEEEHAREKEALKTKPTLHTGKGSWGKYEYVWEEEEQPVVLQDGTKRSRRAPANLDSHALAPKRRKTNEDAQSRRGSSTGSPHPRGSVDARNKEKQPVRPRSHKPEEKAHPASRRGQRPKPNGPIFSATPASPSDKVLPGNDFDIMPLTTARNTTTNDSPIALTDDDSFDSDVEVVATSVARARAVQGGRDEDHLGSNINPIPLSAEEDEANGNQDDSSDEDLFYSTRFSASALHTMPVTPGSVNAGGVPSGTTKKQSTGIGSSRVHSFHTEGISPLKYREMFRGTLSSPDVHPGVQPESYKQPKALTERGKGTRAALEAKERDKLTDPPPLLHSAEAEIARAQQAAAFVESAKRKSSRKAVASRSSKHRQWMEVDPSPSPVLSGNASHDEGNSGQDEQEGTLQDMRDTIVSSQLADIDTPHPPDVTEASARKSVELSPTALDVQQKSPEQTLGAVPEETHTPSPEPEGQGESSPSQQNPTDDRHPAEANSEDTGPLTEAPQATAATFSTAGPLLEMTETTDSQNRAVVISDQSTVDNDISKERLTVTSDIGEPGPSNEPDNLPVEDVPQVSELQQSLPDQPHGMEQSLEPEAAIPEENQQSSSEAQLDREAEVEHSSSYTSSIQDLQGTKENNSIVSGTGLSGHLSEEPARDMTTAAACAPITEAVFSGDIAPAQEITISTRKRLASSHPVDQISVAEIPDPNTSDAQDGRDHKARLILSLGGAVTDESSTSGTAESTELVNAPPLSPSPLQTTFALAVESDQQDENTLAITSEGLFAIEPSDPPSMTHSDLTERVDSVGPESADISMQMEYTEPSVELMLAQPPATALIESSHEGMSEPPHQEDSANTSNEITSTLFVQVAEVPMTTSSDVVLPPAIQTELGTDKEALLTLLT